MYILAYFFLKISGNFLINVLMIVNSARLFTSVALGIGIPVITNLIVVLPSGLVITSPADKFKEKIKMKIVAVSDKNNLFIVQTTPVN